MVAAATMSLPERAAQGRNYNYRYVWIRDQCYAGQAVAADGPHPLLDDAIGFVADRILADDPDLKPAYTITGDPVPDERVLDLPGCPGGSRMICSSTASARTRGPWARPRVRLCFAGFSWRWPATSRATRWRRPVALNASGPPAAPPDCLPRNTTSPSAKLRGNLPQAFVHALLLESSVRLIRPVGRPDGLTDAVAVGVAHLDLVG